MEFVPLSGDSRFAQLQTGSIDLIARNAPWTMRRDTGYGVRYVGDLVLRRAGASWCRSRWGSSRPTSSTTSMSRILDEPEPLANLREFFFTTQATYTEVLYEDREDLAVAYQPRSLQRRFGLGELSQRHAPRPAGAGDASHPARAHLQGLVRPGGSRRRRPVVRYRRLDPVRADQCRGIGRHLGQYRVACRRQDTTASGASSASRARSGRASGSTACSFRM